MKKFIISILLISIPALIIVAFKNDKKPSEPVVFSKKNWSSQEYTKRYSMSKDIIERKLLEGKTKEEVKDLLGKNGLVEGSNKSLSYIVGFNVIDPWILIIEFDDSNRVEEYRIVDG